MPLQTYKCTKCKHETEELFSVSEEHPATLECENCGQEALFQWPMFAKTNMRWGDGRSYYDHGLGMTIENSMHREKVMEEKGLVPVTKQVEEKQRYDMETTINKAADHEKRNGSSESVEKIKSSINKI